MNKLIDIAVGGAIWFGFGYLWGLVIGGVFDPYNEPLHGTLGLIVGFCMVGFANVLQWWLDKR